MARKLNIAAGSVFFLAAAACTHRSLPVVDEAPIKLVQVASPPPPAATHAPSAPATKGEGLQYVIKWYRGQTLVDAGISETDAPLELTTLPSKTFFDICTGKPKSFTQGKRFYVASGTHDPSATDELDNYDIRSEAIPRGSVSCQTLRVPTL